MKSARLRSEEYLYSPEKHHMVRFKAGEILEIKELVNTTFFRTEVPKKICYLNSKHGVVVFEEWDPGIFEKTFEVL
jgi:hypothetical protein